MMNKKILALLLAGMMALSVFAGCSKTEAPSNEPEQKEEQEEAKKQPAMDEIVSAVKEAYGEDYLPVAEIPAEQLSDVMGINMENVEESFAEGPMISAHIDSFIALKAKEGKVDELVDQLNAYRDYQLNDAFCYPMNALRLQGSKVFKNGDYAFYVMLGKLESGLEEPDEEAEVKFVEEQVQIGVDAINALF